MKSLALLTMLILPIGCNADAPPTAATSAAPAPTTATDAQQPAYEPPVAVTPGGETIRLELAIADEERSRGLMFRRSLAPDRGMLFLFPTERRWPFWMKNTWISLDLVYLDASGTVVDVIDEVEPCEAEPCPDYRPDDPARAVLEIGAGRAAELGIVPGTALAFRHVPSYPLPGSAPSESPEVADR